MSERRENRVLFLIILAVQMLLILFWGMRKGNYYWDEYYTFENAHYISASTGSEHYIQDDDAIRFNGWFPVSAVKETLVVRRGQSLLEEAPGVVLRKLFSYRSYATLLNLFEAAFFDGVMSKWSAIVLNLLLFVGNQFFMWKTAQALAKDERIPLLAVLLYGCSGMSLSMTAFVRFYMLATGCLTLCIYLHTVLWRSNGWIKPLLCTVSIGVPLYLAYKNVPLVAVYAVFLLVAFSAAAIKKKRWKMLIIYTFPCLIAGISYFLREESYYVDYLLHPQQTAQLNSAVGALMGNLVALTPRVWGGRIVDLFVQIGDYLFGSRYLFAIWIVFALTVLVIQINNKSNQKENTKDRASMLKDDAEPLLFVVLVASFGYLFASICLNLMEQMRYLSIIYPMLALISAVCIGILWKQGQKAVRWGAAFLLVAAVLCTNLVPQLAYAYPQDRAVVSGIRAMDADAVVVLRWNDGADWDSFTIYESSCYVDADAQMLLYDPEGDAEALFRDDMIVTVDTGRWDINMWTPEKVKELFVPMGYQVELVGQTYRLTTYHVNRI